MFMCLKSYCIFCLLIKVQYHVFESKGTQGAYLEPKSSMTGKNVTCSHGALKE